ncbi:MAG: UDP-N-acetylglucosamine 1-carboxyvinyltransferase [Ruthenibacterium sp.]
MDAFSIEGGHHLFGTVAIPGAKNSVLPMLAASILCRGTVRLYHVPQLSDVAASLQILDSLGCATQYEKGAITVRSGNLSSSTVPPDLMRMMRSSVFYLAPLLARTGRAVITQPGGCQLGARPIDLHLAGLVAMGARVTQNAAENQMVLTAPFGLYGADFTLRFPSVGATETLLMAAVTARGNTVLRNVATEPEIADLARFLQAAGARICGIGTRTLRIIGQEFLLGVQHTVCPDRIVAATVLCAVAGCGGEVMLTQCNPSHLMRISEVLRRADCMCSAVDCHSIAFSSNGCLQMPHLCASAVYPGFPTDALPLLCAALLKANGSGAFTDTVFENRFACAKGFAALGADVQREGAALRINGVRKLHAAQLQAEDLRGGAALCIAAMMAQGVSVVGGTELIARGYESFTQLFSALGARIAQR